MRRPSVIFYWMLLLVSAVAVSAIAWRLLSHESERIGRTVRDALEAKAAALADTLDAAARDTEEELTRQLTAIDPAERAAVLRRWEAANPLIRNVFICRSGQGLVLPDPAAPMTVEQAAFARRFEPLFSGAEPWERRASEDAAPAGVQPTASQAASSYAPSPRQQLKVLAQVNLPPTAAEAGASPPTASGWIPWFAGQRLHLLGWVRSAGGDEVCGVELELMTLLARSLPLLAAAPPPGGAFALLDGTGRPLWEAGDVDLDAGARPVFTRPVGASLPHWQVAYYGRGGAAGEAARGFRLLSGLVVAVFLLAILAGGSLLLWEARRGLREARLKTTFVSNVSHEFKTPLTTIRMYAELIGEGRVSDPDRRRQYLGVIIDESQRLTRLVNNVLDFSRLEQNRKQYRPERLDLKALVEGVLERQRPRLEAAGLRVETALPEGTADAELDRDAVEQVVLNLVDNALKYAAEGGELRVELAEAGPCWVLRVLDRGPGVPRGEQERIFEKFHRSDGTLTAKHPGTGLGLSIARRLARDLGGELRVRARPGGGAQFEAEWPRGDA